MWKKIDICFYHSFIVTCLTVMHAQVKYGHSRRGHSCEINQVVIGSHASHSYLPDLIFSPLSVAELRYRRVMHRPYYRSLDDAYQKACTRILHAPENAIMLLHFKHGKWKEHYAGDLLHVVIYRASEMLAQNFVMEFSAWMKSAWRLVWLVTLLV